MESEYNRDLQASVTKDKEGRVRGIFYFDKLHKMENLSGRPAAEQYIRDIFGNLRDIDGNLYVQPEWLSRLDEPVSYDAPDERGIEYRFSEEKKTSFDTVTYVYCQTYRNTPVWAGGITVELKQPPTGVQAPARVVAVTDTSVSVQDIAKLHDATKLPSPDTIERYRTLLERGEKADPLLTKILGGAAKKAMAHDGSWLIQKGRFFIYRYDAKLRKVESPTLSLPPVPKSIRDQNWYLVVELICRLPSGPTHNNWRILVELETGAILFVRGMSSGVKGNVFILDPVTRGYDYTANRRDEVLNFVRQLEELRNLKPANGGTQALEGRFAKVVNMKSPDFEPPTRPAGCNFDNFDVRTNHFAAVNAYYHVDRFFQLVEDLGFLVIGPNSYFKGTNFPVEVDHRAFRAPWPDGNIVNAALEGHGQGIDRVYFALAEFHGGYVSKVIPICKGRGYTSATEVTFSGGDSGGFRATAKANIEDGKVEGVTILHGGVGYRVPPLVEFKDVAGGGTGAWAAAEIDVEKPIGIATDWRVTLHELGGHGTLWCHVEDDQFKFAHSAGDSFAMILTDYVSSWHSDNRDGFDTYLPFKRPDRFLLLPFEPDVIARRSDRGVTEQSLARVNVTDPGDNYLTVTLGDEGGVKEAKAVIKPEDVDVVKGRIKQVTVTDGGKGYRSEPSVNFSGGGGIGAAATAQFDSDLGAVTGVTVTNEGSGYRTPPFVNFIGGGPARAGVWNKHIIGGKITKVTVRDPGAGYTKAPLVTIAGGRGEGATAIAEIDEDGGELVAVTVTEGGGGYERVIVDLTNDCAEEHARAQINPGDIVDGSIDKVTVVDAGQGYTKAPTVTITGGGGDGARATARIDENGKLAAVTVCERGSGYSSLKVEFSDVSAKAAAQALVDPEDIVDGKIHKVTVVEAGNGYTKAPTVTISGGSGEGAKAIATIDEKGKLAAVTVTEGGSGYRPLKVKLSKLDADAEAHAQIEPEDIVDGRVTKITVADPGKGYTKTPTVTIKTKLVLRTGDQEAPAATIKDGGTGARGVAELGNWGWGGGMDQSTDGRIGGGYFSEQILSSTLFRAYQSIGGDAKSFKRREYAARYMAYLMLRAIQRLSKISNPKSPDDFLRSLQAADKGDWTTEGVIGGAYWKVLAWAFEKQGLKDALLTGVDVYIDDGRAGGYEYVEKYWATTAIWNRRNPDGSDVHQEPALGQKNFAYVKIKNRGTLVANDVIVRGYHCKPSAGLLWPDDLQRMTPPPQPPAGTLRPNDAEEKTVGPFEWTPVADGFGHDCMLMVVSATEDHSNVESIDAAIEDWRLVPSDNNIALRNVVPVPGGGGIPGLLAGLHGKGLSVGNPGRSSAKIAVSVALPPLLANRNWQIGHDLPAEGAQLHAREQRLVTYNVQAGQPFTKADAEAESERDIVVTVTADGAIIGGITYVLDPELDAPFNKRVPPP